MLKKIFILCIFIINILSISVYAKYTFEERIVAANIKIDKTSPVAQISYSTTQNNAKYVEVTLNTNEDIKDPEGFIKKENRIYTKIYDKNTIENVSIIDTSGNMTTANIKIQNISSSQIIITCKKINNSNIEYPQFANKNQKIELELEVSSNNEILNQIDKSKINVLIEKQKVECNIELYEIIKKEGLSKYSLQLNNIQSDGKLEIKIEEKLFFDINENYNKEIYIDPEITVDNTLPECTVTEQNSMQGLSIFRISSKEKIQAIDGWEINDLGTEIQKEFPANVSYELVVKDYAQNEQILNVNIRKATFIKLIYASHNSMVGWTYGYGNYDIAGEKAIQENPNYKTESLAIRIEGNVEDDFIQGKAYTYTYWGPGFKARCTYSGHIYGYGYNPSENSWASLKTIDDVIYMDGKKYFQLGGCGVNRVYQLALTGINPIPEKVSLEYRYGISSIAFKLKDYSSYDIVYQIYVKDKGWISTAKNEEESIVSYALPMSAIRIALIPNSESSYLINQWNRDIGKIK